MANLQINASEEHNQRIGQFISNAISDYLVDEDRPCDDQEVANCLFYMSDDLLDEILERYGAILDARKGMRT